jgi:hypothetical protein
MWGGPSGKGLVYVVQENSKSIEALALAVQQNSAAITAVTATQAEHARILAAEAKKKAERAGLVRRLWTAAGVSFAGSAAGVIYWAYNVLDHLIKVSNAVGVH